MSITDTGAETEGAVTDASTEAPAAVETDPFDDPAADQFPRAYVEKLRNEAKGLRERAKEYDDVFGGIDEGDRQVWMGMAREVYRDPKAGAEWMAKVAAGLLAGFTQEEAEAAAGAEPNVKPEGAPEDKPMTKAELEAWYTQQRAAEKAQADQEAMIAGITRDAEALGYKDRTPEFNNLLWLAANETNGDLNKAHEVLEARNQAIIDAYLEKKRGDSGTPTSPEGGVPTTGRPTQIKSLDDAHRAAKARLEGVMGARR